MSNLEKLKSIFASIKEVFDFKPEDYLHGGHYPYAFHNKSLEEVLSAYDPEHHEVITQAYQCFTTCEVLDTYGQDDEFSGPIGTIIRYPYLDGLYVDFYGRYQSHWGSEYNGMREVTPKEVTVTQYSPA